MSAGSSISTRLKRSLLLLCSDKSKSIFNLAKKKLNIKRQDILTVGDNLNTDILGSNLSKLKSCLVLTGKTNLATAKKSKIKSDYILNNLKI